MFFGRKEQLESLASLWGKRVSSLVTCRGRRRIGKSTLIKEFAKKTSARFIKIEGARPEDGLSNKDELRAFVDQLAAQTRCERSLPENWLEAFIRLDREIKDGEKTVVLLDEISWMGYYDPMFANMVRIAWENYWKSHDRLVLVLCGSVSSWIKEHFIDEIVGRDPVCGADFCGEWRCFGKLSQEEGVSAGLSGDKTPMALTRIRDVAAEKSKAWDFLGMDPCGGGDFGLETAQYCKITEKK